MLLSVKIMKQENIYCSTMIQLLNTMMNWLSYYLDIYKSISIKLLTHTGFFVNKM